MSRERPAEAVTIDVSDESTDCFKVEADIPWLAAATAYFLVTEYDARARAHHSDEWVDKRALADHVGEFDLDTAVVRARESIWRKATLANPYPNLSLRTGSSEDS